MTQRWMYSCLSGCGTAPGLSAANLLPPVLPGLVGQLRAADPDCCWFFERIGRSASTGIGLWVDALPDVLYHAADQIGKESECRKGRFTVGFRNRRVSYPYPSGRDICDELSAVSSDFAMRLLTSMAVGPGEGLALPDAQFALAVAHLRYIAALVPDTDKLPFLFQCWYRWSSVLSPSARVECGLNAELRAGSVPLAPAGIGGDYIWLNYLRNLSQVIVRAAECAEVPVNYLLFDHAHRTHRRLGIPPATEALAVRVVRAELAAGQAPGQDRHLALLDSAIPMLDSPVPMLDPA